MAGATITLAVVDEAILALAGYKVWCAVIKVVAIFETIPPSQWSNPIDSFYPVKNLNVQRQDSHCALPVLHARINAQAAQPLCR